MKIALISLIEDISSPGLRFLSAYLRAKGHDTVLIFLPWSFTDAALSDSNSFLYPYPEKVLKQVAEICSQSALVGISLMTCHFDNAVYMTRFLRKRLGVPIIWGGIHPTLRPGECLQFADMVCVGEGEISLSQLAEEMSNGQAWQSLSIAGIYKSEQCDRAISPAAPSPIFSNLDEIPGPDYQLDHQFLLYKGNVVKLDSRLLATCLGNYYRTLTSRGCVFACSYCCNEALRSLYGHQKPIRWRSVERIIMELRTAVELMPRLKQVEFADDAFLARSTQDIKDFAAKCKAEVGLPFSFITTPGSISELKLRLLAEAGMWAVGIGIQSGSKRIRGLYRRKESIEDLLAASARIELVAQETKKPIFGRYDFILDNPWETEEDVEDSIRLCMKLRKPYALALFSLTFYPGTELYLKARDEGIITDDLNQSYRHSQLAPKRTYLNGVFTILSSNAPNFIASLLLWRPIRHLSPVWLPYRVASLFHVAKLFRVFWSYALRGNWSVVGFNLRAQMSKLSRRTNKRLLLPRFSGAPGESAVPELNKRFTPPNPDNSRASKP